MRGRGIIIAEIIMDVQGKVKEDRNLMDLGTIIVAVVAVRCQNIFMLIVGFPNRKSAQLPAVVQMSSMHMNQFSIFEYLCSNCNNFECKCCFSAAALRQSSNQELHDINAFDTSLLQR